MADISLQGIVKRYGKVTIIDGLDLSINQGEFFTLLGPSGCGKTTLLRIIAGFIRPEEGRITIGGQDVTRQPAHQRNTGMVFQDYALFPDKTVFDNTAYGLRVRKFSRAEIKQRVGDMLERVGLGHLPDRYPGELSGGQRQRVALARALVIHPRVLLMDEPLSNLDAKLRIQMRDVIRELQQELRITTVFVTHDQEEALSMSDRIALLKDGAIDQLDSPHGLYAQPRTAYAADFIGAANLINIDNVEINATGHQIRLQNTTLTLPPQEISGDVKLAARPEQITLHAVNNAPQQPLLNATIIHRRYLGFKATYAVKLADEQQIHVDVAASQDPHYQPGQRIAVQFEAGCRLVSI